GTKHRLARAAFSADDAAKLRLESQFANVSFVVPVERPIARVADMHGGPRNLQRPFRPAAAAGGGPPLATIDAIPAGHRPVVGAQIVRVLEAADFDSDPLRDRPH